MNERILVIDDDPDVRSLVEMIFKPQGMITHGACTGAEGLKKAYDLHPDLIILDLMMPIMDGFEVCSRLRELSNVPILMLTARTHDSDILRGFNVGADDYVKKPFSRPELEARVRALLRRNQNRTSESSAPVNQYEDDVLHIGLEDKSVVVNGKNITLSPIEFSLLSCLVRHKGQVVSHRELMREAWGETYSCSNSTVSLYVHYLRKKLEDVQQGGHQYIHTQWGRGYWFAPKDEA